jgi:hypothetical protein
MTIYKFQGSLFLSPHNSILASGFLHFILIFFTFRFGLGLKKIEEINLNLSFFIYFETETLIVCKP